MQQPGFTPDMDHFASLSLTCLAAYDSDLTGSGYALLEVRNAHGGGVWFHQISTTQKLRWDHVKGVLIETNPYTMKSVRQQAPWPGPDISPDVPKDISTGHCPMMMIIWSCGRSGPQIL